MREIRFFLLLFLLQYYVVPCYAKCAYGIKKEEWPAGTTEEQFIVDGWLSVVGDGQDYLQCEGPGDPFVYCVKGSRVLGADGNIHECNNKKWSQIPPEDIPTCTQSLAVLNDTLEGNWLYAIDNKLPYIYFRDHEYFMKISTVCKYETRKFIDQADECLLKGGDFLPVLREGQDTICDTSDTYDLHITVTDSHNNNLSDVSVEFANLYDQNNSRNVATVADNGEYLVPTTKYLRGTDLIISKSGYIPQTIQIRKLEANPKVILQSETPEAGETETEPTDPTTTAAEPTEPTAPTQAPTTTTTAPQGSNTNQGQTVGKDRLTQAQENLKLAKDTEQSFANRMLGGATTAATGLGMMTAASAYSEKKADEDAEQDMKAYLATFKCEYGRGQSVPSSAEEITLPGGNELVEYYQEYKSLADNLKNTKKALGLRAGIESEVVYDKAESNLYKYSSKGITTGAFTSLSRALTDPEGEDAAAWNAQKEETAKKLKTGVIAAGAGIVAGAVGNYLINKDVKYQELKDEVHQVVTEVEEEHPEVITAPPQPEIVEEPPVEEPPVEEPPAETPSPVAPIGIQTIQLTSIAHQTKFELEAFSVTSAGFDSGKTTLNAEGTMALDSLVRKILGKLVMDDRFKDRHIKISVTGHTDSTTISQATQKREGYTNNQELSEKRAQSVVEYMRNGLKTLGERLTFAEATGEGDKWCKDNNKPKDSPECRRVDVAIEDITPAEQ